MIKIEHVILPSPEQMEFVIEGMRNPLNSWDKSDSIVNRDDDIFVLGNDDRNLMQRLSKAGTDHRKFMRQMPVYIRITAGHTWWSEFDTYKVGTVRNSCSKMHKIHVESLTYHDFDHEGIEECGDELIEDFLHYIYILRAVQKEFNKTHEKRYWRALIEMLPMGFHLTANVSLNYEVLANMYHSRKNHKMDEWVEFCKWIESLPYSELITDKDAK